MMRGVGERVSIRVLIIGSGIGGLSCGIMLARLGHDVTVLEKNRQPGGLLRSYVRGGVHCNVGLHYLGALDQGQALRRCFDFLGIADELSLQRLGADGPVDRYLFADAGLGIDSFDVPIGLAIYEHNLRQAFPRQTRQITGLMALLRESTERFARFDFLSGEYAPRSWLGQNEALGDILERLGCSPGLRAVFGLPAVLIGVPPARCPAFYHTMALASYLASAWRLASHGTQLAEVCVRRLQSLGGQVRCGEAVTAIRADGGRARGVTLAAGDELGADLVISTLHPAVTLALLPPACVKPSHRRRMEELRNTGGMIAVHALVPAARHAAMAHNLFLVETDEAGDARDLVYAQLRPSEQPGQNLLSLITSGYDELWRPWRGTVSGRRGDDYLQAKNDFARNLIRRVEGVFGHFDELRLLDVATPLTLRDWVGSPDGSAYGVMRSTDQLLTASLLSRGTLPGLHLAGQSTFSPGVLGTILGSLATVRAIIGPERFCQEVRL